MEKQNVSREKMTMREFVMKNCYGILMSKDELRERGEEIIHSPFLDLELIYMVDMFQTDTETKRAMITTQLLEPLDIEVEEMKKAAIANTKEMFSYHYRRSGFDDEVIVVFPDCEKNFGQSALLDLDLLRQIADAVEDNLLIISATDHLLIVFERRISAEELIPKYKTLMFLSPPGRFLSTNIYRYNKITGDLKIVESKGSVCS